MTNLAAAAAWGRHQHGPATVPFGWLREGDAFRFAGQESAAVYTKGKRGWYRNEAGVKFRTGAGSSCIPIKEEA